MPSLQPVCSKANGRSLGFMEGEAGHRCLESTLISVRQTKTRMKENFSLGPEISRNNLLEDRRPSGHSGALIRPKAPTDRIADSPSDLKIPAFLG